VTLLSVEVSKQKSRLGDVRFLAQARAICCIHGRVASIAQICCTLKDWQELVNRADELLLILSTSHPPRASVIPRYVLHPASPLALIFPPWGISRRHDQVRTASWVKEAQMVPHRVLIDREAVWRRSGRGIDFCRWIGYVFHHGL
jgi:hypothetical protein